MDNIYFVVSDKSILIKLTKKTSVQIKKLHLHNADLQKCQQNVRLSTKARKPIKVGIVVRKYGLTAIKGLVSCKYHV